uniref:Uncharacterized protein n=1 Tax=Arundo donax TaxID=35708 RepID=A0A0A9GZF1_ARUDO
MLYVTASKLLVKCLPHVGESVFSKPEPSILRAGYLFPVHCIANTNGFTDCYHIVSTWKEITL